MYDYSLVQKLKYWTEKTDVDVYTIEESTRLIQVLADKTNDSPIKLPIIALRRDTGFTIKNTSKQPLSFNSLKIISNENALYDDLTVKYKSGNITREEYLKKCNELKDSSVQDPVVTLNAIPISINYSLDVYTRYQKENDLYIRNLIFNIINYPKLQVHFEYNGIPVDHNSNIILGNNVSVDRSSLRLYSDQICKQSLSLTLDDAYLWDTRIKNSVQISSQGLFLEIKDVNGFIIEQIS